MKFLLDKSAHTHNSGLPKCRKKVPAQIRSFCYAALRQAAKRYATVYPKIAFKAVCESFNLTNPIKSSIVSPFLNLERINLSCFSCN